jgi:hypothetical protein
LLTPLHAVPSKTIILQSQRPEAVQGWQGRCCASVAAWAERQGFAYRFEGDELLARVPSSLRSRFVDQAVVLADLARLLWLREVLEEGFNRAVWVDADILLFRDFDLPAGGDHVGREVWVQRAGGGLRTFRKVHNAWLQIARDSVWLPFYINRASALLERVTPPVVPQFIGPKLLTAWHNIAAFNVEERVGMCSPLTMKDLLVHARGPHRDGPGSAVQRLRRGHRAALCGLNLCASYENRREDGVCHGNGDYEDLIEALLSGRLDRVLLGGDHA